MYQLKELLLDKGAMDSKELCSQILEGNISKTKNLIIAHGEILDSKVAHLILVALSRTVSQGDHYDSIEINDVFQLTIICCENISGLNDNDKENILLSLYHVIKYFCKQKLFRKVLDLLHFVKQHCIDENFKSDVYNYYIPLFHNYVLQNVKDLDGEILYMIINYSLQLQMLLNKKEVSSFISKVKLYTSIFKYPAIDIVYSTKFCSDVLNLLENLDTTENQKDIQEIYLSLLNTLNIIINCLAIQEDDNFPNFINDHFGKSCIIMRKHCIAKEYVESIEILEYFTQSLVKHIKYRKVKDLQTLTECGKKLRALIRKRSLNPIVATTCIRISKILRTLFDYFQNCKNLWSRYLPITTQIELLKMIDILGQFFSKNTLEIEKCCGDCKLETDIYHGIVTTSSTGILTINSVRLNLSSEEFHILSLRCLALCCKFLNKLKEQGCEKYVQIWKLIGIGLYNTAVVLYRNKDYKFSKLYSQLFIKNVISLEGIDNPELCFANSLGATLHLCAVSCYYLQEKKESFLYLALTLLLSVEYKKKSFQTWVMMKSNDPNDEEGLKSTTVHHILLNEQEAIKEIYPLYKYSQKDCEILLMDELEYYCDNWQSKIPLISVCNELCKISENLIYRTRSFAMTWEKVVPKGDSNFIENLEATIKMASASNINIKMCRSVLYYIQYQYKMNEIVQINIAHMNEADIPSKKTPLKPYEEPPNPNDKCDIVPAYYNMKVDNLLKIYEILDGSLKIWDNLLENNKEKLDPKIVSTLNIGHFIKLTAYEYRMQFFITKMLKTWILYYKIMKQLNNKRGIITSIGFIIEYSDCKSKVIKALEKEAEDLLSDFDSKDPEQLEIYLTYYINKSSGYLKSDMINEGYSALQEAEEYLKVANDSDLEICKARILHLKTCYLMLKCSNKILNHDENFLTNAQNSFTIVAEYYTTKTAVCPYLLSIILEISLANGWMYKWLRLPREVRCYTKESILLAQKCVLPIRIAQFLSLLAFTDLLDKQYSDCEVKLNGLTKMLCYASNSRSNVTYELLPIPIEKFEDVKLESPGYDFSDMDNSSPIIQTVLDYSTSQRKNNTVTGSPELKRKRFVLPEFMKHSKECDCFMCSNSEYQKLIFDIIHLEALLNLHQNRGDQGEGHFKGGLSMWEKLCKKSDKYQYKSLKLTEKEIIFACVYKNISQSYCTFLLNYSNFLTRRSALTEAKNIVEKIFNILSSVKHVNIHFWNELMIQKYNLFIEEDFEEKVINIEYELLIPEIKVHSITPENKTHLAVSPMKKIKPVKSFKKLTFDLSGDEKDENMPRTPQHTKNLQFKFQTPAKTPSVPKIKIYTPKTVKSKRSTSKATAVLPNQSEKKKILNKQLEERTKLLTQKLKAEIKPVLKDHSNVVNNPNTEYPSSKLEVRKKLLDDLEAVTDSIDKLTVENKKTATIKEIQASKVVIPTSSTKKVDNPRKKYSRIKIAPTSSSSSDGSLESSGSRRSTRIRKTENNC